jgi:hypothetical protein
MVLLLFVAVVLNLTYGSSHLEISHKGIKVWNSGLRTKVLWTEIDAIRITNKNIIIRPGNLTRFRKHSKRAKPPMIDTSNGTVVLAEIDNLYNTSVDEVATSLAEYALKFLPLGGFQH